ncbi:DUF4345 domain-containing protein [Veronia pacifica]|uniref:DUF4345 domain-containing protein n=1 Tax=Veronia pacifica TaxID=1080227 RepID=A0A1C3EBP4_9GAMM|nr:DUF4345 domain-containing protein [Veronia pacifica]ODA30687.1 hypothetical protein A8L45_19320 [Veronia pacifica]
MRINLSQALLLVSAVGLIPISLSYGVSPSNSLGFLYGINVDSVSETHIYRAVMGLYIFNLIYWLLGAIKESFRESALIVMTVFMFGLAAGRLLSLVVDGYSHWLFVAYFALEVIIGTIALFLVLNNRKSSS